MFKTEASVILVKMPEHIKGNSPLSHLLAECLYPISPVYNEEYCPELKATSPDNSKETSS